MIMKKYIKTITNHADYLAVNFENEWFQEDIETFSEVIFEALMPISIQEKILGADRENIRFTWREHCFILNFDCYSQSCWFEGQDGKSTEYLAELYLALVK